MNSFMTFETCNCTRCVARGPRGPSLQTARVRERPAWLHVASIMLCHVLACPWRSGMTGMTGAQYATQR